MSRKKNKAWMVLSLLLAAFVLTACGNSPESKVGEEYKKVADHLAEIMLPMDHASYVYGEGLAAVSDYLEGAANLEDTLSVIEGKTEELWEIYEELGQNEIPEEVKNALSGCRIDPVEYQGCMDERITDIAQYIQGLTYFKDFYIVYGEDVGEEWQRLYDISSRMFEAEKAYHYYHINYFCASWDEDAAAYVKKVLVEQLTAYKSDYYVWETDRDTIEATVASYLDIMEECVDEEAELLEKRKEELYQTQP